MQEESKSPEPKKMRVGLCRVKFFSRGGAHILFAVSDILSDTSAGKLRRMRATQHRNPFAATTPFPYRDAISLQRPQQLWLLFTQNTGQNQPLRAFQFWQDLDEQSAEQICCNDVDPGWKFPLPDVRDSEIDLFDLTSTCVFFRCRDCDRAVVNRNYAFRAKASRCRCQYSRTGSQTD